MSVRIPAAPPYHPISEFQRGDPSEDATASCEMCTVFDPLVAAWRWFPTPGAWHPVCRKHARGGRTSWPTPKQCEAAGQPYRRPAAKATGPSKTALRAKCDRLFAEYIRSEGSCEAAVADGITCSDKLQCAHIISRKWLTVRWMPENAVCLCSAHHVFYTHHELHWERWRDAYVSQDSYSWLREQAMRPMGPPNYTELLADLERLNGQAVSADA